MPDLERAPLPQLSIPESSADAIMPRGFELFQPEERRTVAFDDLEREPHKVGKLPLFTTIDFGQPAIELKFAVIDALSTGYQRLGLCALNPDGSYDRYHVGGYPLGSTNYRRNVTAGVIVRVGNFDPEA